MDERGGDQIAAEQQAYALRSLVFPDMFHRNRDDLSDNDEEMTSPAYKRVRTDTDFQSRENEQVIPPPPPPPPPPAPQSEAPDVQMNEPFGNPND